MSANGLNRVDGVIAVLMQQTLSEHPDFADNSPVVEEHLDALVGLGPASFTDLQRCGLQKRSERLRIGDLLRERTDGTIALLPCVRRRLSNQYVDRFLDDALALLDVLDTEPGYFYPAYNLRARQHGGACGIEGVKPAHHYPQNLVDAMADLRGDHIITNIGQSGCYNCSLPAVDRLQETLKADGQTVLGGTGFSAQTPSDRPILHYGSFDDAPLTTRGLGQRIIATFDAHDVPYEWDGDPDTTIETYPKSRARNW